MPQVTKKLEEWMADPLNSLKVKGLFQMSNTKAGDIHQEIATFVNTHCHTDWTKEDVWSYFRHIKAEYSMAEEHSKFMRTGSADDLCPHYATLKKVFRKQAQTPPSAKPAESSSASA